MRTVTLLRPPDVNRLICKIAFILRAYRALLIWRGSMDLNYLFYRQQVERSRSNSAECEKARKAHEELAAEYERQIGRAVEWRGNADATAGHKDSLENSELNPTMAVAITARSVGRR
jgi:hypothetical protein